MEIAVVKNFGLLPLPHGLSRDWGRPTQFIAL